MAGTPFAAVCYGDDLALPWSLAPDAALNVFDAQSRIFKNRSLLKRPQAIGLFPRRHLR